jgi:signal transduction histidine kinase
MSSEQLKKVFEPFYTTKSQGLGLGMAYAQKIVEQHGGTVSIESHPR